MPSAIDISKSYVYAGPCRFLARIFHLVSIPGSIFRVNDGQFSFFVRFAATTYSSDSGISRIICEKRCKSVICMAFGWLGHAIVDSSFASSLLGLHRALHSKCAPIQICINAFPKKTVRTHSPDFLFLLYLMCRGEGPYVEYDGVF